MSSAAHIQPRLLTLDQAADYLQVPKAEVNRQAIGRVLFGTKARYDRVALDAWLDERRGMKADSPAVEIDDEEAALARTSQRLANATRRP